MEKRYVERLLQFLPESTLLVAFGCVAWALSGLGSHAAMLPGRAAEGLAVTAPPVPSAPLRQPGPALPLATRTPTPPVATHKASETPGLLDSARIEHAKELLGKFYDRSVVRSGEEISKIDKFVRERVAHAIKKPEYKKHSKVIADTVLSEAEKNDLDPVFIMAVIENESSFNPHAVGPVGEIGLMQLTMPTGKWIAQKLHIKWEGKKTLRDPRTNIRLGAAYLALLREQFDFHSRLYLAAYNMGSGNVRSALGRSIWPKDYARAVMRRYIRLYTYLKDELKSGAS